MKFAINNMKFSIKTLKFSIKTMKFSIKCVKFAIKNMKFSIRNMKFSVYEVYQNSPVVLFVTEFSYNMYRKNAFLNGKQKQMKPLMMYPSYNIRARVVYKLKTKVKFNKVIKWFVLLFWSVRP